MTPRALLLACVGAFLAATPVLAQRVTLYANDAQGRTVVADSLTISYEVNGLRVIQRPTYGNRIVAIQLYLLGGTRQLTPATAGIELLALVAANQGSCRHWRSAGPEVR
jgi:hypothetical protein